MRLAAKKLNAFSHLAHEALQGGFRSHDVGAQLRRPGHDVAPLAHREIAEERNQVSGEIDEQHSAQPDAVVNESDDGAGNQPASLDSRQQKSVRMDKLFSRE